MEAGGGPAAAPAPAAYEIRKNQDVIMRADWPEQGGELLGCRTLLSEGHVAVLTDDAVLMPRFIVEATASDVVAVLPAAAGRRRLSAAGEGAHALLCDKLLVHRPGDRHPTALRLPASGGFVGLGVVPGAEAAAAPVVHVASAAGGGEGGATALRLTAYPLDRLAQEPRTEPASLPAVSKANAAPHVLFARHGDGVRCVAATGDDVASAAISSDGRFVAVVGRKGGLRCYEVAKGAGGDAGEKGTGEVVPIEAHGCPGSAGCSAALVCEVDAAAGVTEAAWLPAATGCRWHVAVVASGSGDGSGSFVRVLDPFAGGRVLFEEACEGAPMLQRSACRSLSGLSFGVVAADSPRDVLSVETYTLACSGGAAAAAAAAAAESGVGGGSGSSSGGSKEDAAVWQRAWDDSQQRRADVRLIFPHLPRTHVEALCRAPTPGLSAPTLCAMLRHLAAVEDAAAAEDGVQHKLWLCLAAAAIICNPAAGELEAAKGEVLVPPREAVVRWYTVLAAARCRDGAWEELLGGLAASGRLTELAVVLRLRCRGDDGAVDAAAVLAQCPASAPCDDFVLLLPGTGYATALFVGRPATPPPAGGGGDDEDDSGAEETRIPVEAVPQDCLAAAEESAILEEAAVRASRRGLLTHASDLLEHARGGAATPLRHAAEELLAALHGVASADACALLFGARAPPRAASLDVAAHAARPPAVRLCAAVLAGCAAPRHYEAAHVRPDQQAAVELLCGPLAAAALAAGEGVVLPLSRPALCRTLREAFAGGRGVGGGEGREEEDGGSEADLAAELQQALSSLSPGFVAEGVNVPGALLEAMVAARRLGAARGFALKLLRGFQGADRHALGTVAAAIAAAAEAVLAEAASLEDAEALERCEAALTMWEDDVLAEHPEEVSAANAGVRRCEDLVDYACQAARQRLFAWGSLRDRFPRAAAAVAPAPQGVGAAQAVHAVLQAYPRGELSAADVAALCRDAASLGLPLGDAALAVLEAAGETHAVAACTVLRQAVDDEGAAAGDGGEASASAQEALRRFTAKALERLGWETLPESEWAYLVESAAAVCGEDGFDALLDAFSEGSCAYARRSRSRRGSRGDEGEGLVAGIVEKAAQCVVHRGDRVRGELEAAAGLAAVERAEAAGREAVREAERDARHFAARALCELEGDEVRGRLRAAAAESAARGGGLA
eukprot:Rhum_TRINITY_DN8911_c0_g1::Rhum_TRINITY_DN8911_c0_g1_i1::g.30621::m.30621